MRALPIRLRLTSAFVLMMAAVLLVAGLFIYLRVRAELDHGVDGDLRSRAAALAALVGQEDSGLPDLRVAGAGMLGQGSREFEAILDSGGTVLASLPSGHRRAALTRAQLERGIGGPFLVDTRMPLGSGGGGRSRLYVQPVRAHGRRLVIVTGVSLAEHDAALRRLTLVLLLAGPAALALATLGGYGLASGALRPVESMRRRATEISAAYVGQRLPIPPARDEISRLGASLNEMLDRLETTASRERAFVADASHELRTPLGVVKSELELALSDGGSVTELRAAIVSAAEENDHAVALAEDLLTLARSDEDKLPLHIEVLPVDEIFASVIQRFVRGEREARGKLSAQPAEGLSVKGDRLRIMQALSNLVDNALRHGGEPVCLLAVRSGSHAELHVRDRGEGFAADFLPRAFDRFARGDVGRTGRGTGLGLAIVHAIASAHGGNAHVANLPGGADAWISVPAAATTAPRHGPAVTGVREQ